jgi:hypothetical protein
MVMDEILCDFDYITTDQVPARKMSALGTYLNWDIPGPSFRILSYNFATVDIPPP